MKRITRVQVLSVIGVGLFVSFGVWTTSVSAAENTVGDRYRGSFILEENSDQRYLWYVNPESGERYAINSSRDFSRLLQNLSTDFADKDLRKIATVDGGETLDFALADRMSGLLLRHPGSFDAAWYVNPLDVRRYELANGQVGYEKARELALDINTERLTQIPVTKALGFNEVKYTTSKIQTDEGFDFDLYSTVFETLRSEHLFRDSFTDGDLFYGSLEGMAEGTGDPHTAFFGPEQNRQQRDVFFGNSAIEGIGAIIEARANSLFVIKPLKSSPAARAGLLPKDQILAIDGLQTEGISLESAVSKIKGPAGTEVVLTIYREGTGVTGDYRIKRERIEVPSVSAEVLGNNIVYIEFSLFTDEVIYDFQKLFGPVINESTRGIVLDLRNNIGGLTHVAAQLADYWLDEDQRIFSERRRDSITNYVAPNPRRMPEVPTVILTNDETASASEILTAALRQYGDAISIGETTYGKGTGQTLLGFPDGSGLKYTTFEWLTPAEESIDGVGIVPDILVHQTGFGDQQLDRAKEYLLRGF
ncbi:MAG: S41 family peptidase [Patescibacteria group bacterium]